MTSESFKKIITLLHSYTANFPKVQLKAFHFPFPNPVFGKGYGGEKILNTLSAFPCLLQVVVYPLFISLSKLEDHSISPL